MNQVPTVYIIDDNARVLVSLARLVRSAGFQVITYRTAGEFLSRPVGDTPGCLVLDIFLQDINGLDLQQALAIAGCHLPIVFMTAYGDIPMSVRAMKAGAVDFLSKPFSDLDLLNAIRSALDQNRQIRQAQLELDEIQRRLAVLTPRERQVLALVVTGKLNKQIAAVLGTCEKTIKVHRGRVMDKLQARSLADLVRLVEKARQLTAISSSRKIDA